MKQLRREQQKTRGAGLRFAQCGAPLEAPPYLELEQRQQMEDFGHCLAAGKAGRQPAAPSARCTALHSGGAGGLFSAQPPGPAPAQPGGLLCQSPPSRPPLLCGGAGGPCQIGPRLPGAVRTAGQRGLPAKPLCPASAGLFPTVTAYRKSLPFFLQSRW